MTDGCAAQPGQVHLEVRGLRPGLLRLLFHLPDAGQPVHGQVRVPIEDWAPLGPEDRNFAQILEEMGYVTMMITDTYRSWAHLPVLTGPDVLMPGDGKIAGGWQGGPALNIGPKVDFF